MTESSAAAVFDDDYRKAAVDLLGAIAYGELSAFERLAEDTRLAPTIEDKMAIGGMAAAEFGQLQKLCTRITELGADPADRPYPGQRQPEDRTDPVGSGSLFGSPCGGDGTGCATHHAGLNAGFNPASHPAYRQRSSQSGAWTRSGADPCSGRHVHLRWLFWQA